MKQALLTISLLGVSLIGFACGSGGGGGESDSPPPPIQSAAGIWDGTVTSSRSGQAVQIRGIVTQNNEARFVSDESGQYSGSLTVNNSSASGILTAYAAWGYTFPDYSRVGKVTFNGNVSAKSSFPGTYSGVGDYGSFSFTYNPVYDRSSSLEIVAGTWNHNSSAFGNISVIISNSGSISGTTSDGCSLSGNISLIDPAYNGYRVAVSVSKCSSLNGSYNGLAAVIDTSSFNDTLVVGMSNSSTSIAADFYK